MNAQTDLGACAAKKRTVIIILNRNVIWKEEKYDNKQSKVGCPQIYSDNSHT